MDTKGKCIKLIAKLVRQYEAAEKRHARAVKAGDAVLITDAYDEMISINSRVEKIDVYLWGAQ